MRNKYRELLYKNYTSTHIRGDGQTLLKTRGAYLKNFIRNFFPKDKTLSILEVGCGYGALIHYARLLGYENISGIDVSPQQVLLAKELGVDGISVGGLQDFLLKSSNGSYGLIIAFDVVEHMDRNELINFLEAAKRILKKNGQLILHLPNGASPFFGRVRYGDLTHEICFTQSSVTQILYAIGFMSVECYEEAPVVVGISTAIRWMLWKVIRTMMCITLIAESGESREIFSQNMVVIAR